jgi:hypothetical protein
MGNMALAASDLAQYTRWFKGASLGDDLVKQGLSTAVKDKTKGKIIGDLLKEAGARNIKEYNEKFIKRKLNPQKGHAFLPFIVLVVDEFADLIMTAGKEVEMPIARLAQLAPLGARHRQDRGLDRSDRLLRRPRCGAGR